MRNRAFTIIEILVVITVIAVLAGLLFAAGGTISQKAKATHTKAVIGIVASALAACESAGQPVNLTEHPLAGSCGTLNSYGMWNDNPPPYPRPRFVRENVNDESAYPLSPSGEAYALPAGMPTGGLLNVFLHFPTIPTEQHYPWTSDSSQPEYRLRVMLPNDRFHEEGEVPHLYGVQRERIGIVGGGLWNITWYRKLPLPVKGTTADAVNVTDSDGVTKSVPVYKREVIRRATAPRKNLAFERFSLHIPGYNFEPTGRPADHACFMVNVLASNGTGNFGGRVSDHIKAFEQTLGSAGALTELTSLGAISAPTSGTDEAVPMATNDQFLFRSKRVWYDSSVKAKWNTGVRSEWRAGLIKDPATGVWKPYRLRGPAIYDAWGTELLIAKRANGRLIITSAGADRCFQWHPGQDGAFQTAANATTVSGNDRAADRDNVIHQDQ